MSSETLSTSLPRSTQVHLNHVSENGEKSAASMVRNQALPIHQTPNMTTDKSVIPHIPLTRGCAFESGTLKVEPTFHGVHRPSLHRQGGIRLLIHRFMVVSVMDLGIRSMGVMPNAVCFFNDPSQRSSGTSLPPISSEDCNSDGGVH